MDEEEGLSVVMTPVQLAAILTGVPVSEHEIGMNRLWGGLEVLGGTLELVGAGALLLAPEPTMVTKVGGVALGAHGADTFSSGLLQVWTGKTQRTYTYRGSVALAQRLGADPDTASKIGTGIDIAVPLVVSLGVGAARIAAIRSGRLSLEAVKDAERTALQVSENAGGHTIERHVGKTVAELQERLIAEPKIPAATTFKTLEAAERVLYKAIQANKAGIESWAQTAGPGATTRFTYAAGEVIGEGVVRATGKLQQMSNLRFVLKMEKTGSKIYYILTAFPIP